MQLAASDPSVARTVKLDPLRRFINRIRHWLFRDEYQVLDRRLGRLEAAWRQQTLAQDHAIEIARSFEGRVSNLEREPAEFMMVQLRLAKVESSSRHQAWAQSHAIDIAQSFERRFAKVESSWRQHTWAHSHAIEIVKSVEVKLAKLESIWRQQLALQLHTIAIEDRLAALEAGWRQHIPAFLNAVSSVGAIGFELSQVKRASELANSVPELREAVGSLTNEMRSVSDKASAVDGEIKDLWKKAVSIDNEFHALWEAGARNNRRFSDLWHRTEFIRREILFEMQHKTQVERSVAVAPRILDSAKLAAAHQTGRVRLNIGCGHIALDDYINVDRRDIPGIDVVGEAGNLPFDKSSVDEIISGHLLEHFPQEELRRQLLPYWMSLLKPGGTFRAVVPDGEAMVNNLVGGTYAFEDFRAVLFGGQDYDGDFHYNLFTPESLKALLSQAGFVDVEMPVKGRVNGQCFEFEIRARKPSCIDSYG
jgi:hypothetical protein